jgi:8-oxo-dGTP pyrophosphatase MutT (NUDIX family)
MSQVNLGEFVENISKYQPKMKYIAKEQSSVAIILRLANEKDEIQEINFSNLLGFFLLISKLKIDEKYKELNLEICFILRAFRKNDTWSNQVGFPGGMKETNENNLQTAIRETKEEIGIDLNS